MIRITNKFDRHVLTQLGTFLFSVLYLCGCEQHPTIPIVPSESHLAPRPAPSITLTAAQEAKFSLTTKKIIQQELDEVVETTGQVQATVDNVAHVFSPVTGPMISVSAQLNQQVSKGTLLGRLKSDDVGQLQVQLLQDLAQNTAELRQAEAQTVLSKANYDRERILYEQRVSPRVDFETARAQYQKDQITVHALAEKKRHTIANMTSRLMLYNVPTSTVNQVLATQRILPFINLYAPKSGIVIKRDINVGEIAQPDKELFVVADLDKVWLVGEVYEKFVENIKIGQPVHITFDGIEGKVFEGHVSTMDAILDAQTRTLQVRVLADNRDHVLKPNMFARLQIKTGQRKVLAIPTTAIQKSGDASFVYVLTKPHTYEERKIKEGMRSNGFTEVSEGLLANEQILVNGTLSLRGEFMKQQNAGQL